MFLILSPPPSLRNITVHAHAPITCTRKISRRPVRVVCAFCLLNFGPTACNSSQTPPLGISLPALHACEALLRSKQLSWARNYLTKTDEPRYFPVLYSEKLQHANPQEQQCRCQCRERTAQYGRTRARGYPALPQPPACPAGPNQQGRKHSSADRRWQEWKRRSKRRLWCLGTDLQESGPFRGNAYLLVPSR